MSPSIITAGRMITVACGVLAAILVLRADRVRAPVAIAAVVPDEVAPSMKRDFGNGPTVDQQTPIDGESRRRILALFDATERWEDTDEANVDHLLPVDSESSFAHRLAELPLNHLGLAVDHFDIDSADFPGPEAMKKYRGVLVWLADDRVRHPQAYLRWLISQLEARRKVVVIGYLGGERGLNGEPAPRRLIERVYERMARR